MEVTLIMKNLFKFVFALFALNQLIACSSSGTGTECLDTYYCNADNSMLVTCCTGSVCTYSTDDNTWPAPSGASDAAYHCTYNKTEADLATKLSEDKVEILQLKSAIDGMYMDLGDEVQE